MAANRLIHEKSPYLLQHAYNPVDWHAWNEDTFRRAKAENKPVFLSIGYATCHWCHVMEKESFEDPDTARVLNDTFVCVKVDREERPDIDAVYMSACQMLTGSGGWPLSIFMTPDKHPFFAATYIPKETRFGRTGLIELAGRIKELWHTQPAKLADSASGILTNLDGAFRFKGGEALGTPVLDSAYRQIRRKYDPQRGGFEPAPKFPMPHRLFFLLRHFERTGEEQAKDMVLDTLQAMRLGGIWDHVGYGFHRYSTDKQWLLPHFEKMLYDQALMAMACLEAYQVGRQPAMARTAGEIFEYIQRDMTADQGAFLSAEDADSEGEEGKFYVWGIDEFRQALEGMDADMWERVFNLNPHGNFFDEATGAKNGANILHLTRPLDRWAAEFGLAPEDMDARWGRARQKLFAARETRERPLKDDKILTDWNGLMIAALALGARVLQDREYAARGRRAADFILAELRDGDGRLRHRFRAGEAGIAGQAADYAFFIHGLLQLYQATYEIAWAERALELQEIMLQEFWDGENGAFFLTGGADGDLPVRPKELYDGALPSANSVALYNLLQLGRLTGDRRWEEQAQRLLQSVAGTVGAQPAAFTFFLLGMDFALRPGADVVVAGQPESAATREFLATLAEAYSPRRLTLLKSRENADRLSRLAGYTEGLQVTGKKSVVHICKDGACRGSTTDISKVLEQLQENE
jgi:uncharacterized protein YyaL (SSP411 family)